MVIRIGLIGCGIATQKAHIPAIIKDQRFRITALCRRDKEKLKPLQSQFPNAKMYTAYKDLIESGNTDCVLVAADVDIHLSIVQCCLDNDIYALVEKPVDSSSEDIQKFIDKNPDRLHKIMVAFNKRFYPGVVKFNELVETKQLSRIIGGTIVFITQQSLRKKGKLGVLQNLIHSCDLVYHIFGKPTNVKTHFSLALNDDVKGKTISSSILTEKGCAVNLFFTSSSNWKVPIHERVELFDDRKNKYFFEDADRIIFSKQEKDGNVVNTVFRESNSIFYRYNSFGYEAQISKFGDVIEGKIKLPSPNIYDALNAQILFEEIFKSDKNG